MRFLRQPKTRKNGRKYIFFKMDLLAAKKLNPFPRVSTHMVMVDI